MYFVYYGLKLSGRYIGKNSIPHWCSSFKIIAPSKIKQRYSVLLNGYMCNSFLHPLRWTTYARTKLDTFIEFPLNGLDMSSYLLNNLSGTRFNI